ncbi:MAG: glutamine synthetase beta-grasp domain-containing protein [Saprospiraceae bacterium]|nr:glutamine synthetase beta-grasp domain-containing protein [Saprospiraceae bacterium]
MTNHKFEYIWLDGYTPEPHLRSKTKVIPFEDYAGEVDRLPLWAFDGSSTKQAEGHSSDLLLKPCTVYRDPARRDAWLVMCEVLNPDETPHVSNTRALIEDDPDFWFGFEQEYTLVSNGRPMGFPKNGYPAPQGMYYCSVGSDNVAGRDIVEEHFDMCLDAGLSITGINAEVMLGQWEYQCFGMGAKRAADDLWVSRYLLFRISEKYGVHIEFAPKPVKGDWNGSGMHANFSNKAMREIGGEEMFNKIFNKMAKYHQEHIAVYGSDNHERLTGLHETQHIDTFSYGVSDRGSSIRIPIGTVRNDWKGYLEDRRPASNADPYRLVARIMRTVKEAMVPEEQMVD